MRQRRVLGRRELGPRVRRCARPRPGRGSRSQQRRRSTSPRTPAATATGSSRATAASSASVTPGSSARPAASGCKAPVIGMAAARSGNGYWLDRHRRRRVHLRRRRVPRLARQPAAQLADPRRSGDAVAATATGSRRPTVACSPSATPSSTAAAHRRRAAADRRHGRDAVGPRLLAPRLRRRCVRLRRRRVPRRGRRPGRCRPRSASPSRPTARATGSLAPERQRCTRSACPRSVSIDRQREPGRRHRARVRAAATGSRRASSPGAAGGRVRPVEPRSAPVPRVHACARDRPRRRLPRGEPERHLPRCVPVLPLDVEQHRAPRRSPRPRRCRPGRGRAGRPGLPRAPPVPVAGRGAVGRAVRRQVVRRRHVESSARHPASRSVPGAATAHLRCARWRLRTSQSVGSPTTARGSSIPTAMPWRARRRAAARRRRRRRCRSGSRPATSRRSAGSPASSARSATRSARGSCVERRKGGTASKQAHLPPAARRLRRASGPTYIKLGQIISGGEGLFPEELVARVQAAARPRAAPSRSTTCGASSSSTSAARSTTCSSLRPHADRGRVDRAGARGPAAHRRRGRRQGAAPADRRARAPGPRGDGVARAAPHRPHPGRRARQPARARRAVRGDDRRGARLPARGARTCSTSRACSPRPSQRATDRAAPAPDARHAARARDGAARRHPVGRRRRDARRRRRHRSGAARRARRRSWKARCSTASSTATCTAAT